MTDLSDTTLPQLHEEPDTTRRFPALSVAAGLSTMLVLGGALVFVRAGGPSGIGSALAASPRVEVASEAVVPTTAVQVASSPPVAPCVTWAFGADQSEVFSIGGSPCVNASVVWAGATAASAALASSPTTLGPVVDPLLDSVSTATPGQIYDGVVVMPEVDPLTGHVSVVARSTGTFDVVWTHGCSDPAQTPAVHFSGGQVTRDPAANRTDMPVFGKLDYVAVSCAGALALYDPLTGSTL
ncbi:MAG: hypothetical protein JWL72_1382 [Ilumatobacteraceae bacterium]|nr:hypothetical protein [Ilumatobacteraceae bacterium]